MVKLWSFGPNWRETYQVNREFRTDITKSRSDREQRRALRSTPRKTISFTATVAADTMTDLHRFMVGWQHQTILMPDLFMSVTTSGLLPNATALAVSSVPTWLKAGAQVVLIAGNQAESREVLSVAGSTVTFTSSSTASFVAGARLHRGMIGTLATEIQASRPTNGVAEVKVEFNVEPASEPADLGTVGPTFNGRELWLKRPNWADAPSVTFSHPSEVVDYGRGRISRVTPAPFSTQVRQMTFVGRNAVETLSIEQFFDRMKGQQGEFYMPTWDYDIKPKVPALVGENAIRVRGRSVFDTYASDTVYRAIAIFYRDGSYQLRKVAAIEAITDDGGQDSSVRCTTAFSRAVDPADIVMVCWMPVWRFATDSLTTERLTSEVGRFKISVTTLEDLGGQ